MVAGGRGGRRQLVVGEGPVGVGGPGAAVAAASPVVAGGGGGVVHLHVGGILNGRFGWNRFSGGRALDSRFTSSPLPGLSSFVEY